MAKETAGDKIMYGTYGTFEGAGAIGLGALAFLFYKMGVVAAQIAGLTAVSIASFGFGIILTEAALVAGVKSFGSLRRAFSNGGHGGH